MIQTPDSAPARVPETAADSSPAAAQGDSSGHSPQHARLHQARAALQTLDHGADSATVRHPPLYPLPGMDLTRGRVHEITGPARRSLAAIAAGAAAHEGPVMWLRPAWRAETLCPQGLPPLAGPALAEALILAHCRHEADILASMEEALRAGCVALVLAEIATAPDLRQIRRLHLAAAEGCARAGTDDAAQGHGTAPLGLLLAQDRAESRINGVESRWALHPLHPLPPADTAAPRWRLERLRARDAPPAAWQLTGPNPITGAGLMRLTLLPAAD